jgi:hypothetical protein
MPSVPEYDAHASEPYSCPNPHLIDAEVTAREKRLERAGRENLLVAIAEIEKYRTALNDHAAAGAEKRFCAAEEAERRVDERIE